MIWSLQRHIRSIKTWTSMRYVIEYSEFDFKHNSWDKPYRYIVIRKDITKIEPGVGEPLTLPIEELEEMREFEYVCFITNSTKTVDDLWYLLRQRCNDENIIQELKEDFALNGFSLDSFYGTECAMYLRIMMYNVIKLFKDSFLEEEEKTERLKPTRKKYIIIPAILGHAARYSVLRNYQRRI